MKIKKTLSLLLSMLILSISLTCMVYADTGEKEPTGPKFDNETQNVFDKVMGKHEGVKILPLDQFKELKNVDKKDLIKINSEEELDALINYLRSTEQIDAEEDNTNTMSANTINSSYYEHISWYAPASSILSSLFCWKNITFDYTIESGEIVSVDNIDSYISGLNIATWNQNDASYEITDGYRTDFTIDGYYLTGVEYNGQPAGIVVNDTWERTWYWD